MNDELLDEQIRRIKTELHKLGYRSGPLPVRVLSAMLELGMIRKERDALCRRVAEHDARGAYGLDDHD